MEWKNSKAYTNRDDGETPSRGSIPLSPLWRSGWAGRCCFCVMHVHACACIHVHAAPLLLMRRAVASAAALRASARALELL